YPRRLYPDVCRDDRRREKRHQPSVNSRRPPGGVPAVARLTAGVANVFVPLPIKIIYLAPDTKFINPFRMISYQIKENPEVYDAVVVGSGAGGGMAGYVLAQAGLKVLMLEAGPFFDPAKDTMQLRWPWESPRRGAGTVRPFGDFNAAYGGWKLDGEPYSRAAGTEFEWFRARMLGGRTNHWGRISLRMGPDDFKPKDGVTDPWPITYDELKPYYDRVDRMIGIYGTVEGIPNEPDGIFLKPPKPRLNELYIRRAAQKAGVPVIAGRGSVLTEALPGVEGRGTCFYCGQCGRACRVYGDF